MSGETSTVGSDLTLSKSGSNHPETRYSETNQSPKPVCYTVTYKSDHFREKNKVQSSPIQV